MMYDKKQREDMLRRIAEERSDVLKRLSDFDKKTTKESTKKREIE